MERKYTGYIPDKIEPEHWVLGASTLPQKILRPNGQWTDYLPKPEDQKKLVETYNCTGFATVGCVEMLFEERFGAQRDYSERFTGIAAGTYPPGNSIQAVCEAIRKNGVIKEEVLPFDNLITTVDQYYSPKPLTKDLLSLGKQWMAQYGFGHEWVFTSYDKNSISLMKQALQYSPLAVPVYAWRINDNGLYVHPEGLPDVHLTKCVGYEEGKYWIIFDSYEPYIKHLDWNFPFGSTKRFHLEYLGITDKTNDLVKNSSMIINSEIYTPQQKVGVIASLLAFLKKFLFFLQ